MKYYLRLLILLSGCNPFFPDYDMNFYKTTLSDGAVECCFSSCYHICSLICTTMRVDGATNYKVSHELCYKKHCNQKVCEEVKF